MGFNAVIYIAALTSISPEYYEAATIDGASRFQRIIHINLPCILPTIIIMLIMRMGQLVSVGYEKVFIMQSPLNLDTAEVISTFVYKRGIENSNYSFAAAVDLFNNVVNVTMLLIANKISSKVSDTSLF